MQVRDRIIVAVDRSSRDDILRLVDLLAGTVGMFKIGLQAFIANGPSIVREVVSRGERVFLDLKINDIPNTAERAVAEAAALGAAMITVHAVGGEEMLRRSAHSDAMVVAVTILTSFDEQALARVGFREPPLDAAVRLATLARSANLPGVVASPHEIAAIRAVCGGDFVIVTPGIRPEGADRGDQRRTTTPAAAIAAGADYIVVGRPVTEARDARAAVLEITDQLSVFG